MQTSSSGIGNARVVFCVREYKLYYEVAVCFGVRFAIFMVAEHGLSQEQYL